MLKKLIFPTLLILIICIIVVAGCEEITDNENNKTVTEENMKSKSLNIIPNYKNSRYKEVYLAGGCFWGIQAYFDRITGI